MFVRQLASMKSKRKAPPTRPQSEPSLKKGTSDFGCLLVGWYMICFFIQLPHFHLGVVILCRCVVPPCRQMFRFHRSDLHCLLESTFCSTVYSHCSASSFFPEAVDCVAVDRVPNNILLFSCVQSPNGGRDPWLLTTHRWFKVHLFRCSGHKCTVKSHA
jgi:hypothetical protein